MITVVLVVHLLIAISLVGVVLLQKSEGGALGMGGGGMSGFMTGRSTANLLTRTTAILAACFFATSIGLAVLAAHQRAPQSVIDLSAPPAGAPAAPVVPAVPAGPATPTVSITPGPAPESNAPAPAASAAPAAPAPEPSAPLAK